jgi:hypothetical protein
VKIYCTNSFRRCDVECYASSDCCDSFRSFSLNALYSSRHALICFTPSAIYANISPFSSYYGGGLFSYVFPPSVLLLSALSLPPVCLSLSRPAIKYFSLRPLLSISIYILTCTEETFHAVISVEVVCSASSSLPVFPKKRVKLAAKYP